MKRALAAILLAWSPPLLHAQVTSEGRAQDAAPILDASRVATYRSAPSTADVPTEASQPSKLLSSIARPKVYRATTMTRSSRSAYFHLYDAGNTLTTDRDVDGYRSEFRIRFDADVSTGDALVYAKLYLRRVGDTGGWQLYHTTNDFWIHGQSDTDDYYVDTTLDQGFPTAEYDVLIDLYESGYSGVVATLEGYDTAALSHLPLEEVGLDVPFGLAGYSIHGIATSFLIDDDRDGYYSRFRVSFDPDSDYSGDYTYAVVWVRPQGGAWIKEHTSDDFPIDVSGTADSYSFTADWISGYPTANYDIQIDLYDAATGLLVASAGSERPELSRLPLEDQAHDRIVNPPNNGGSIGGTTSGEYGGGAMTAWFVMALVLLVVTRKLNTVKKIHNAVTLRSRRRERTGRYWTN
jgi:hypothetical protein